MLVRNKNFETIDLDALATELSASINLADYANVTEAQAKDALAKMYYEANLLANQSIMANNKYAMPLAKAGLATETAISNLWEIVRKHFCAIVTPDATKAAIVAAILAAIASITPLGVILIPLVTIIIAYFMKIGIEAACSI